jgi:zinc finger protein
MEGLLQQVYEELSTKVFHTGGGGDSSSTDPADKNSFTTFLGSLKEVMAASRPFTLILDDPVANSYLQNIYAPDDDPNMEIITYERTHEQNEELGINDMVLTGYENEHPETESTEVEPVKETEA